MISEVLGFVLVALGMATADSESLVVPMVLMLTGVACLIIGGAFSEPID